MRLDPQARKTAAPLWEEGSPRIGWNPAARPIEGNGKCGGGGSGRSRRKRRLQLRRRDLRTGPNLFDEFRGIWECGYRRQRRRGHQLQSVQCQPRRGEGGGEGAQGEGGGIDAAGGAAGVMELFRSTISCNGAKGGAGGHGGKVRQDRSRILWRPWRRRKRGRVMALTQLREYPPESNIGQ